VDVVTLDELPDLAQPHDDLLPAVSPGSGLEWLLRTLDGTELGLNSSLSGLWSVGLHLAPNALLQ
jgi:hypothetical protein